VEKHFQQFGKYTISVLTKCFVEEDSPFDEFVFLKRDAKEKLPNDEKPSTACRWREIFQHFQAERTFFGEYEVTS
jgi:hypothetical protein